MQTNEHVSLEVEYQELRDLVINRLTVLAGYAKLILQDLENHHLEMALLHAKIVKEEAEKIDEVMPEVMSKEL